MEVNSPPDLDLLLASQPVLLLPLHLKPWAWGYEGQETMTVPLVPILSSLLLML